MKKLLSIVLCIAILISFAGCGGQQNTSQNVDTDDNNEKTISVVDHLDNTVEIPAEINRIAVCSIWPLPSVLSVFFNSAEKIVAMPEPSLTAAQNSLLGELYPEILDVNTSFMTGNEVNVEELMKLDPDVVFYSASLPALGEQLTRAGFSAVAVSVNKWDYDCIETLNNWIKLLSEIFPENDKSAAVEQHSKEIYQMIQERIADIPEEEKPSALFLYRYDDTELVTSGSKFFGQWWAESCGAVNVGQEIEQDNAITVNMEQVYAWNPDIVFLTNFTAAQPQDIYENTIGNYDWQGISATENKRVYKCPLGIYRSYTPGADTPVTLLWYAKTVYPELFQDINLNEEAAEYYKAVFGIELTPSQIETIFAPPAEAAAGVF